MKNNFALYKHFNPIANSSHTIWVYTTYTIYVYKIKYTLRENVIEILKAAYTVIL